MQPQPTPPNRHSPSLKSMPTQNLSRTITLAAAAFFALAASGMAQTRTRPANTPKWEAVSIKPCGPNSLPEGQRGEGAPAASFHFTPDRMTLHCMSVRTLIQSAYKTYLDDPSLPGVQGKDDVLIGGILLTTPIAGGSDWIDSERYTIEAKAERPADRALMQGAMLQIILEDRFQLKIHWENREIPVYALTVAKGGPKFKRFQESSCTAYQWPEINDFSGPPPPPPALPAGKKYCSWGYGLMGNDEQLQFKANLEGITMDQLAKLFLSGLAEEDGRKVIDKTGLKGKFDIHMEHAMSEQQRQRFSRNQGRPLSEIPSSPSIFTALQEQLGLKLEPAKAPVEHLVIDRVARPSPN